MDVRSAIRDRVHAICRRHPACAHLFTPFLRLGDTVVQHGKLHRQMDASIARYCTPEQVADRAFLRRTRRDLWFSLLVYFCPFDFYFMYGFGRLSHAARCQFVSPAELRAITRKLTTPQTRNILQDKWNAYQRFREDYRRDALRIDGSTTAEALADFMKKHPRFLIKPVDGSCGRGVRFYSAGSGEESDGQLLETLRAQNVMLEEPIVQCQALAQLHPQSVNTVRCATFSRGGEVHILFTFLRIGRGDAVVDNGGAGGYVALVDTDTGVVVTPGTSERLERANVHPDTGAQIIGFQIPRWEEMKAFAIRLSRSCPELPHIHWDLALTDSGWVIVEGNHGGGFVGPQLTTQRGLRRQLQPYFDL